MRIIYDVGSNNGDDIPYYLRKSDLVVAIEADPDLAALIRRRFEKEIGEGRVVLESVVIDPSSTGQEAPFYIHQGHHVLSQMTRPPDDKLMDFKEVRLPTKRLIDIIGTYGSPHYVKIDLEGMDQSVLSEMFSSGIFPPYLSAESHSIDVFCALVAQGKYRSFKLIDGLSIPEIYGSHTITTADGSVHHHFPEHSAGPFGNDLNGPWESPDTFFETLAHAGLGWRDIHVSSIDPPER